jgi:hypothetical protein
MITFRSLQDTIAGTVNGKPFNMPKTEANIEYLKKAQKEDHTNEEVLKYVKDSRNAEIAMANKYIIYRPATGEYFLTLEGVRSTHAIPQVLVDYIEESYDKEIEYMPVVKAWARLLSNPRYNDEMGRYFGVYLSTTFTDYEEVARLEKEEELDTAVATKLATYQDIAITQEGLLATYKVADIVTWKYEMVLQEDGTYQKQENPKYKTIPAVIDETTGLMLAQEKFEKPDHLEDYTFTPCIWKDGDQFYSGDKLGYVYRVGEVQYLPKDAKRNLNNTGGGGGLYSGGLNYIKNFRGCGSHVLTCFVDPADILSYQAEGHAFRTDALMPNNVWDETIPLKGAYHSSTYGKLSKKRIEEIVAEALSRDTTVLEDNKNAEGVVIDPK